MEIKEAKMKIAREFIEKYHEWLGDMTSDMSDWEFGKKWEVIPRERKSYKDNQKALIEFQRYHSGRWLYNWVKQGYEKQTIWALHQEGFLSLQEYSNYMARALGNTYFYYINQNKAKEIWKYFKSI